MFGALTIHDGNRELGPRQLGGVKPRHLFELLLVNPRAVSKDELIDSLWGDRAPRDPVATLEAYVSVLRSNLQPGRCRDDSVIATYPGAYRVLRDRLVIDVDRFDALSRSLPASTEVERRSALVEACELAARPILENEPYAEWVQSARHHYERRRLEVFVVAAQTFAHRVSAAQSLDYAERAIAIDGSCEAAYVAAMQAAGLLERRDLVGRLFERCARSLMTELGVAPLASTFALKERLLDERVLVSTGGTQLTSPSWPLLRFL
jgi:DNA-binding SARP family transcriptional activator